MRDKKHRASLTTGFEPADWPNYNELERFGDQSLVCESLYRSPKVRGAHVNIHGGLVGVYCDYKSKQA